METDFHPVNVVSHQVVVTYREDGSTLIKAADSLDNYARCITDQLDYWAEHTPEHLFIAQRTADNTDWRRLNYGQALQQVKAVAQYLLDQKLSVDRPVAILSGNSTEHLIVGLAAMYVGIPYSPISSAYSLISGDFGKLRHIHDVMTPGLVFVDNLGPYRDAIDAVVDHDCVIACTQASHGTDSMRHTLVSFDQMAATAVTAEVEEANARVSADTIAKFLFTSGSTGMPKGVINTQRMLCSNQEMLRSVFAFLRDTPPVICDWLPWNHTFGGNHNAGIILYNGGSLYIDEGKPVAKGIHQTISNLADVAPTMYFNVPKGYEFLVKELQAKPDVAKNFFSKLQVMYFAGAGLSQHVWDQLDELSISITGKKVPMLTGLGSTETAPAALFASIAECQSGVVGVPAPGVEVKLVPNQGKLEARIKGVSITPGYWRNDELTAKAFDDEGYYCLGDALKFIDSEQPQRGFMFDGRVSEDFKLDTGTWVSVGTLRPKFIHHCAPYVQDVVIAGRDHSYITALVFPDMQQCRQVVQNEANMSDAQVLADSALRQLFARLLKELAVSATGSSTIIKRLILLATPPQIDAHEITDKGSINQNSVIQNRAQEMKDLYTSQPSSHVILLTKDN